MGSYCCLWEESTKQINPIIDYFLHLIKNNSLDEALEIEAQLLDMNRSQILEVLQDAL